MELGLSLGPETLNQPFGLLKENNNDQKKHQKFDFTVALSLNNNSSEVADQELSMKAQKSFQKDDDDDEDDDEGYDGDEHTSGDDASSDDAPLQLNLLPVSRKTVSSSQLPSLPWSSSDNGSSENGSSGNVGPPAMMVLNVNRRPAPVEEISSSANSLGSSPFHMDLTGACKRNGRGIINIIRNNNGKRGFEAIANDVVEGCSRASDDDDNDLLIKGTRKKLRLSKEQSAFLEERFKDHSTLNPEQKLALAKQLNLRPRQVEVWFQNRRARTKLKQTEVDCEYLKRCCEKLSEENRKLQKELQELRALKTSNTFNMHMPATTLTMCPSCERVATTTTTNNATSGKSGAVDHNHLSNKPKFFPFSHQNQPKASQ